MKASGNQFMNAANQEAASGVAANEGGPFGAVVVRQGAIVGRGHNRVIAAKDPTAHAEIEAIRDACRRLGTFLLNDCELYTTCEPCPMCLSAIYWARIPKIYYACTQDDAAAIGFDDAFLYRELAMPARLRSMTTVAMAKEDALAIMKTWFEKEDKVGY